MGFFPGKTVFSLTTSNFSENHSLAATPASNCYPVKPHPSHQSTSLCEKWHSHSYHCLSTNTLNYNTFIPLEYCHLETSSSTLKISFEILNTFQNISFQACWYYWVFNTLISPASWVPFTQQIATCHALLFQVPGISQWEKIHPQKGYILTGKKAYNQYITM